MNEKTMGQIAYEGFRQAYADEKHVLIQWENLTFVERGRWNEVARSVHEAILLKPVRADIVGGPIEMRDYDYITLAQPHRLEYPADALGFPTKLPAGTKLHMVKPEPGVLGITYETGAACKAGARTNDLVAEPRKEPTK